MADKCDLCLLGLIILSSLLSGTSEVDDAHVFISSGQNVRLPCNNALSDCTSTTWNYNRFSHSTVDLITGGMKKKDTERHESLSLGSDCSLNINNVTIQDFGFYTCQQYENGQKQGTDARVYLHVLHVSVSSSSSSSSSSQTEISPGRSVTLSCQLYSDYGFLCDYWVRSEDIELLWVNQAGVDLQTDSRYQISAPDHCNITLTTTLLNEDHNREWRCQLTHRNQLKTSVTHTVKSSGDASEHSSSADPVDSSTLIPVSSSNSEKKSSPTTAAAPTQENQKSSNPRSSERTTAAHTPVFTTQVIPHTTANSQNKVPLSVIVIVIVAASFAVLLPVLILWLIRKKRAGNRRETDDSVGQTDDVTYTEVTAYSKSRNKKNKVCCDDKVTYSSIGGANAGAQENCSQLYASVNKNRHKSVK